MVRFSRFKLEDRILNKLSILVFEVIGKTKVVSYGLTPVCPLRGLIDLWKLITLYCS